MTYSGWAKKAVFLLLLLLFCNILIFSQNLVPNPSFEEGDASGRPYNVIEKVDDWDGFLSIDYLFEGTSEVTGPHYGGGNQVPFSGNKMLGIRLYEEAEENYREFISAKLREPLEAGVSYFVQFYVSLSEKSDFYTDDISLFLTDKIPPQGDRSNYLEVVEDYFAFTPQVQNNNIHLIKDYTRWYDISGLYTATGNESYLVIGNFLPDEETTKIVSDNYKPTLATIYFFIDDVSITRCDYLPSVELELDTIICEGESIDVDMGIPNGTLFEWNDGFPELHRSFFTDGFYWLKTTLNNGCEFKRTIDVDLIPDVRLGVDLVLCENSQFPILISAETMESANLEWSINATIDTSFLWVSSPGEYWINSSFKNCTSRDSIKIHLLENEISVFPNPNDGNFKLLGKSLTGKQFVTIYDFSGRKIEDLDLINIEEEVEINMKKKLAPGNYIIHVDFGQCDFWEVVNVSF